MPIGHHSNEVLRPTPNLQEHPVKVHHILFLVWIIVFAFWMTKQFSDYNKKKERE
jgi:hypothetical protein